MGHNLGMLHDFDDKHGGDGGPCDKQGIMSYGTFPQKWSTCSKAAEKNTRVYLVPTKPK